MNKLYFSDNLEIMHKDVKPLVCHMHTLNYMAQVHRYQLLIGFGILTLIPNALAADTPQVPAFPGTEVMA